MVDYSGYGFNYFNQNRCFAVLKKGETYVAVHDLYTNIFVGGYNETCNDFQLQGFILSRSIWAINSSLAIEQAKELDANELDAKEINRLQVENDNLRKEVDKLKIGGGFNDIDPYLILGFKSDEKPNKEEISIKKKRLALAVHPDRGGSEFLMKLINAAGKKLNV